MPEYICWRCGTTRLSGSSHAGSDHGDHYAYSFDQEKEWWEEYVRRYKGMIPKADDSERCHFCGRTAKDCKDLTDAFIEEHFDEFTKDSPTENLVERLNFIKKLLLSYQDGGKTSRDIERYNKTLALLDDIRSASDDLISKYSSWGEKKYNAAVTCDYPFANGEKKELQDLLDKCMIFYTVREELPLGPCNDTIGSVYGAVKDNYDKVKEFIEVKLKQLNDSLVEDLPVDESVVHKMIVDYHSSSCKLSTINIGSFELAGKTAMKRSDGIHSSPVSHSIKFDVNICWICRRFFDEFDWKEHYSPSDNRMYPEYDCHKH